MTLPAAAVPWLTVRGLRLRIGQREVPEFGIHNERLIRYAAGFILKTMLFDAATVRGKTRLRERDRDARRAAGEAGTGRWAG